jgi:short chain dehydrogenase
VPDYLKQAAWNTPAASLTVRRRVSEMLGRIEREGEHAVRRYSVELDGWSPRSFVVTAVPRRRGGGCGDLTCRAVRGSRPHGRGAAGGRDGAVTACFRLDGRHAVVAGASRGIGAATALAFASAGAAKLTLMARTRGALAEVASTARRLGADARVVTCDVTDDRGLDAAFDGIDAVDVLVYAAGTNVPQALDELELNTADRLWR